MNPLRSFAPDLIRSDLNTTWIYVVDPLLDQRAADISVDHPRVVENYRSAHSEATFAPLRRKYER